MKSYEMVETLSNKAHVSLEQAKEALERSNWDILDAAIYLERQKAEANARPAPGAAPNPAYVVSGRQPGTTVATPGFDRPGPFDPRTDFNRPPAGSFAPPPPPPPPGQPPVPPYKDFPNRQVTLEKDAPNAGYVPPYKAYPQQPPIQNEPVGEFVGKLAGLLENVVNHIFGALFVVKRRGAVVFAVPLLIFIIAMFGFWWALIPLLVLGVAFECKYSLGVRDKNTQTISDFIDKTVNTALNSAEKAKESIMNETQNVRAAYEQSKKEFTEDFKKGKESVAVDLSKKDEPKE